MIARQEILNMLPEAELTHEQRVDAFMQRAGTVYGLLFGVLFALLGWGYNAARLASVSAHDFWVTAAIGAPVTLLVCVLAGRLAARPPLAWLSYVYWVVALVAIAIFAAHVPYEGANAVWGFLDPSISDLTLFPFGVSAEYRMVILAIFGALLGVATAFLQNVAATWAWDSSTAELGMTRRGWAALLLFTFPALLFAFATDNLIHSPLRAPQEQLYGVVTYLMTAPRDAREIMRNAPNPNIPYFGISLLRDSFTPNFKQYLATYELESLDTTQVDVFFDNGFILRCNTSGYGDFVSGCRDLKRDYGEWMTQLMHDAALTCSECPAQVNKPTLVWLAERRADLPQEFTLTATHGPGPLVYLFASDAPGHGIQCRFRSGSPTLIDVCRDVP